MTGFQKRKRNGLTNLKAKEVQEMNLLRQPFPVPQYDTKQGRWKTNRDGLNFKDILTFLIALLILASILLLTPTTPERAVRWALIRDLQPAAAFQVKLMPSAVEIPLSDQSYYEEEDMKIYQVDATHYLPQTMDTKTPMLYWDVRKAGIFYIAEWNGVG